MDLSRTVYSRDLKITVMRALDAGARLGEVARKYQLSPKCWNGGAANGGPKGNGLSWHRATKIDSPAGDDRRSVMELERKIGQLTMEKDFLKKAWQHFKDHHPPAVGNGGNACLKKSSKPRRKARL